MGSKQVGEVDSPSTSSVFLPMLRRRGSMISVISQVDKETRNQTLDNIHSAASQSDALTTFNEFAPPPQSSAATDSKTITSDLQGGLSGLYNRLRASVGAPKEQANPSADTPDDTSSTKSSKLASSTTNLTSNRYGGNKNVPVVSPAPSSPSLSREAPSTDQLAESQHSESSASQKQEAIPDFQRTNTESSTTASLSSKTKKTSNSSGRISLGPTIQKLAEPAVAGVTVNATKAPNNQSRDILDAAAKQPPVSSGLPYQIEKQKTSASTGSGDSKIERTRQAEPSATKGSSRATKDTVSSDGISKTLKSDRSSSHKDRGLNPPDDSENTNEGKERHKASTREPISRKESTHISFTDAVKPVTQQSKGKTKSVPVVHNSESQNAPQEPANLRSAGDPLPRNISTDTVGIDSPSFSDSYTRVASDDEALHTVGKLPSKPKLQGRQQLSARGLSVGLTRIKSKVLSKEYWMRDENAKDCFECGTPFSTFRRKHHCRTCGQIFDNDCTVLISGTSFGQSGTIRVCKRCEVIINGSDDSSEYCSDDASVAGHSGVRRHGSSGAGDLSPVRSFASLRTAYSDARDGSAVPTMAIQATRKVKDESKKRPDVLEIDAAPKGQMVRPGSSRSLKSMTSLRPHSSGHRRHHSRSLLPHKLMKAPPDDAAPFHRQAGESDQTRPKLSAFHSDNVIDPELADFMSDENSSGDDQPGIMATLNGDAPKNEVSGLFPTSRKGRSKRDKSFSAATGGRDSDSVSLSSARISNPRSSRRRNLSIASHLRSSPRFQRLHLASPGASPSNLTGNEDLVVYDHSEVPVQIVRSSAMKGDDAPAVELNSASIQHVRRLLSQLLIDAKLPSALNWEKALMPILLRTTDDVTPDVQHGDAMDIRHYVKIKKIPGGRSGDTSYVSGLVFTKNLALKSMPRSISYPSILVLTFPLEYSRHKQQFMSLDLLIRQEREYLQNIVHRIAALNPSLLLCQKNISGLALEFLDKARIATAYNVKLSVLEAVARFAQTRIIHSLDKIAVKPTVAGRCESFYLKTYLHENKKKTYMYLTGCPKELGCTIVLRGADAETLRKIKRITEYMLYVVYNLKLETSFLRDEFALIPSYTGAGTVAPDKETKTTTEYVETKLSIAADVMNISQPSNANELSEKADTNAQSQELPKLKTAGTTDSDEIPDDIPMPTFYGDTVEQYKDRVLSASPFVRFMPPYLLLRARDQERRLVYLKRLLDQDIDVISEPKEDEEPEKFALITPDMMHGTIEGTPAKVREVLRAAQYAEYEKAVHNYRTQKKQWEAYASYSADMFNPLTHQMVTVLYSVVCIATSIPCAGPQMLSLGFYNEHESDDDFEADITLGQYVEDLCLSANSVCFANGCEKKMVDHHRQYVHGSSQLSVTIGKHPPKLQGLQDIILMWSICRICSKETQVCPMSENTWKYSFGQYLELSFWSHDLHAKAGLCTHDLHRNHMRFFGFKGMAVRFQYDSISLLEIVVPRTRITWKVVNDLNFKNETFTKAQERVNNFFHSVQKRLEGIKIESVICEKADDARIEVDRLRAKAKEDQAFLVAKLQAKYSGSKYYEIIPLNRALRAAQEKVSAWDMAFAEFDRNFFPSEKDISRLAALQLKKIFLDKDESVTSLNSNEETASTSEKDGEISEKVSPEEPVALIPQTTDMSPEIAHDMLSAVVENESATTENSDSKASQQIIETLPGITESPEESTTLSPTLAAEAEDVRHLDLAVPLDQQEQDRPPLGASLEPGSINPKILKRPANLEINTQSGKGAVKGETGRGTPSKEHISSIPRPSEGRVRRSGGLRSPPLIRTQSQPGNIRRGKSGTNSSDLASMASSLSPIAIRQNSKGSNDSQATGKPDRRLTERLGLSALKASSQSMIPRSIIKKRDTKVSTLAKHFEQLSKEFEKERLRDRNKRATRSRLGRAYPTKSSKPVIEVYRNVHEAVLEREPSDEDQESIRSQARSEEHKTSEESTTKTAGEATPSEGFKANDAVTKESPFDGEVEEHSRVDSRQDEDTRECGRSDDDNSTLEVPTSQDSKQILSPSEVQLDLKLDLPKYEKKSLMNMLRAFWAERSASGWEPLDYITRQIDHIFADSDVIIREDEPSSLIAFALDCDDYQEKIKSFKERSMNNLQIDPDKIYVEDLFLGLDEQRLIEHSLLQSKGTHLKYVFPDGPARMTCKIFWAEQFDAVRRKCGVDDRFIECLSRCFKWDSKGGKTKSIFLKTLDDRIVLKSLSQIETQSFLKFAPFYFQLMGEALFHDLPSAIAKMLGFFQVIIKNPVTGSDVNLNVLAMENLFYDRSPARKFDLKGSMRNRRVQPTGEQNEVLLDENMVEFIYESPIFVREHSKRLLRSSVYNDTLFLARQNVMDYSLMVAIDESRKELVVGMIDCIRTYTWDKKVETWMKSGKNRPTVTSPREYKSRFREAMNIYILQAPNCWHQFGAKPPDALGRSSTSITQTQEQPQEEELPADLEFDAAQVSSII